MSLPGHRCPSSEHHVLVVPPGHLAALFPFVNFLHLDLSLASHRPDHVNELGPFGDLVNWYGFVVAHPFVAVELYPDCLDELIPVMVFHHLVPEQYVWVVGVVEYTLDCAVETTILLYDLF